MVIGCDDDVVSLRSALVILVGVGLPLGTPVGCGGDSETVTTQVGEMSTTVVSVTTTEATTTTATSSLPGTTAPTVPPPLFDFADGATADTWSVVNDTVMGGVSSGRLAVADGMLVFTGELSLDNNGGFASVRSPLVDAEQAMAWADRQGPRLVVEGDGRTWTVEVRTGDPSGGWIATLPTSTEGITDAVLPWTSFEPVTRFLDRREADEPLDPRDIAAIAFYLVDGIEAPFRLGIRSIS